MILFLSQKLYREKDRFKYRSQFFQPLQSIAQRDDKETTTSESSSKHTHYTHIRT